MPTLKLPAQSASVRPGDVLAHKYRVERVLGTGGMGCVVAATHVELQERRALKFMLPHALADEAAVERFLREARAAVRLKSPHTVDVLDVGRLNTGEPYLVMEFLEGEDVKALLERGGPLPIDSAVDLVLQAVDAIDEAHDLGIVHRDLKPANLFLARGAKGKPLLKVLDFGVSKLMEGDRGQPSLTQTDSVMGSPAYMSPEQMRSAKNVDTRTDIWALGVVLYELLTGKSPFEGTTITELALNVVGKEPSPLRAQRLEVPQTLEAVVLQCLAKDPDQRFQTAGELAGALRPFGSNRGALSADVASPSADHGDEVTPSAGEVAAERAERAPQTKEAVPGSQPMDASSPPTTRTNAGLTTLARRWPLALLALLLLLLVGVYLASRRDGRSATEASATDAASGTMAVAANPKITIDLLSSEDKQAWLTEALAGFAQEYGNITVRLETMSSVEAAQAILDGRRRPTAWCPADDLAMRLLADNWRRRHGKGLFAAEGAEAPKSLLLTPVVAVAWADRAGPLRRSSQPSIWAAFSRLADPAGGWRSLGGDARWDPFALGRACPLETNAGLQALVLLAHGYYPHKRRLAVTDVTAPAFVAFMRSIQGAVDKADAATVSLLDDMVRFGPSRYDVVVATESLALKAIHTSHGRFGELEIIYPEPTMWTSHPLVLLHGDWVSEEQKGAVTALDRYLTSEQPQKLALKHYFRPSNPAIAFQGAHSPFRDGDHGLRIDIEKAVDSPPTAVLRALLDGYRSLVEPPSPGPDAPASSRAVLKSLP